jgi:hypothetical protein
MLSRQRLILSLAVVLLKASVSSGASVYLTSTNLDTGNNQFGTVDLTTGAFQKIGPDMEGSTGLALGPNESLLTLGITGNLNAINPGTGLITVIGSTGLGDCSTPASPCPSNSANTLGGLGGAIYATDLANNLYRVSPSMGAATLVGPTGIPALPFIPFSSNPDGTFNAFDETLFGANGKLYAVFDAFTVSSATFKVETVLIPDSLYQIDPSTGGTAVIAPTDLNLAGLADVNGTVYAFDLGTSQIVTLDLTNGKTSFVTDFDPGVGIIAGAVPTPEPFSLALAGVGVAALVLYRLGSARSHRNRADVPS